MCTFWPSKHCKDQRYTNFINKKIHLCCTCSVWSNLSLVKHCHLHKAWQRWTSTPQGQTGPNLRHTSLWNSHGVLHPGTHGFYIVNTSSVSHGCAYTHTFFHRSFETGGCAQPVRKWFCLWKRCGWPHTHNIQHVRFLLWPPPYTHTHNHHNPTPTTYGQVPYNFVLIYWQNMPFLVNMCNDP